MMKRLATTLFLLIAIPLGGCELFDTTATSILQGGRSITAQIVNPAKPVNIYQVKLVYATAGDLANEYRSYCYPVNPFVPYASLVQDQIKGPICAKRRAIVTKLQKADDVAFDAIGKAEAFIAANPKLSAVSLVQDAWAAVVSYQGAINSSAASVAPVQQ